MSSLTTAKCGCAQCRWYVVWLWVAMFLVNGSVGAAAELELKLASACTTAGRGASAMPVAAGGYNLVIRLST